MPIPIAAIGGALIGVAFFLQSFVPPLQRETTYALNRIFPNLSPGIADAIDLRTKGIIGENVFLEYFLRQGYTPTIANRFWESSRAKIGAEAVLVLYWRGKVTEGVFLERMSYFGFSKDEAEVFNESRKFYPSPTDLVNWQAKEVFEPDAIKKYGLDNEYELIDKEAFYKAGMDDEQIRNYWRAHWQHPSLNMIYSLLHRGLITQDDVYEYYRLVEIPPYWRDKLTTMSYPPYTRVDTRRMYEMGVLTEEQVLRNYLDLGYDDEKAANMTQFTVAYSTQKDKDLTKSQIEKAYEYGILTESKTIELLQNLGYNEEEALFVLGLKAYAIMQDELDDKVSTIKTRFRRGLITQEQALSELDRLEISPVFRDKTIAEILRVKQTEFQLPTKADIGKFFVSKLIDEDQYKDYMGRLGFQEAEIELYLKSFKL